MEAKGFTKNAASGPHVSAHNAFATVDAAQRRRELEDLDVQYAKVCKRYEKQKKKKEAPKRETNDAYVYGAYGYPMYYPAPMMPYYADPSACEYTQGSSGNTGGCAAGTCCNSVSMGGCAGGQGTPGCAASCGGHGGADGGCGTCGGGGDGGGGGCGGG
jgi:hypothetical protein